VRQQWLEVTFGGGWDKPQAGQPKPPAPLACLNRQILCIPRPAKRRPVGFDLPSERKQNVGENQWTAVSEK
jgi:hypothetical protein